MTVQSSEATGGARSVAQPVSIRLAEVLGALSGATDLANGFAPDKSLRTTVLAMRLADLLGLPLATRHQVYWSAVLRFIGCTGYAHEEGSRYSAGQDIQLRNTLAAVEFGSVSSLLKATVQLGRGAPALARARAIATFLTTPSAPLAHARAQCDAGVHLARQMGMEAAVLDGLGQTDEHYDGKGLPNGLADAALSLPMRVVQVAHTAELFHAVGGVALACETLRKRRGAQFDPAIVDVFVASAADLLEGAVEVGIWHAFLEAEPAAHRLIEATDFQRVAGAFGMFADLKSVWTIGHHAQVAGLAHAAALAAGLSAERAESVRLASLLHDLGRVSVPNGIWDKPGPLDANEWERVRLHAYHTERVLRRSPALGAIAQAAIHHHERLDGSGYHRELPAAALGVEARLIAASDVYCALRSARPHRPAFPAAEAAAVFNEESRAGRLCPQAVRAVLQASGQRPAADSSASAGHALTEREQQVLRLIARGSSNKAIARELGISPRTAEHHVAHIYNKIGVGSRAGATLFAVERGLLRP